MLRFNRAVFSGSVEGSGGGESAPAADTSSPSSSEVSSVVAADIKAIMDFDPFSEPSTEPGSPADGSGAGAEVKAPTTAPVEQPVTTATPAAPVTPPPTDANALAEAAAALRQTAEGLPAAVAAAVTPQKQEPEVDPWTPVDATGQSIDYGRINIPDQIIAGMASENPAERKAATAHLIGSVAHMVQRNAVAHAVQMVRNEVAQAMPRYVNDQLVRHQQTQEVFQDFYGKFPQLSNPAIRPVVVAEAQKLMQQGGHKGWTPAFRDQLGQHVLGMLRAVAPAPAAPPPPATGVLSGLNARPGGVGTPPPAANPWDDLFGPT